MSVSQSDIDRVLQLQLAIAWAGEADTDPARLGWWRTAMADEYAGEDLLRRLTPKTWPWAALEAARAAAQVVDARARAQSDDPDRMLSLYRFGFEIDERLDERLLDLKQSGQTPDQALPDLLTLTADWAPDAFADWLQPSGQTTYTATATGRRLRGTPPASLAARAARLAAALLPLADHYPLPYFRIKS